MHGFYPIRQFSVDCVCISTCCILKPLWFKKITQKQSTLVFFLFVEVNLEEKNMKLRTEVEFGITSFLLIQQKTFHWFLNEVLQRMSM